MTIKAGDSPHGQTCSAGKVATDPTTQLLGLGGMLHQGWGVSGRGHARPACNRWSTASPSPYKSRPSGGDAPKRSSPTPRYALHLPAMTGSQHPAHAGGHDGSVECRRLRGGTLCGTGFPGNGVTQCRLYSSFGSSPPRPKIGSPPLSRTSDRPLRAKFGSRVHRSRVRGRLWLLLLFTHIDALRIIRDKAQNSSDTRLSWPAPAWLAPTPRALTVSNSASPGPAPTQSDTPLTAKADRSAGTVSTSKFWWGRDGTAFA